MSAASTEDGRSEETRPVLWPFLDRVDAERLRTWRDVVLGGSLLAVVFGAVAFWASRSVPQSADAWGIRGFALVFAVAFGGVGAWILSHRLRNRIGWLMVISTPISAVQGAAEQWAMYALGVRGGAVPGGGWAAWVVDWIWVFGVSALAGALLVFPDGRFLSLRWRRVGRIAPFAVGSSALLLSLWDAQLQSWPVDNPAGVIDAPEEAIGLVLLPFAWFAGSAVVALVARVRRAEGDERTQLRWLVAGAVPGIVVAITSAVSPLFLSDQLLLETVRVQDALEAVGVIFFGLIPVTIGIGIVRHQLFDIDLAINRALVVGTLVAFVTVVYAAFVGGVGALLGDRANLALSIVATGLVAVGFHPVRLRVQRWANRLIYGERATPYEVLSAVAERLEGSLATDELLDRITESMAQGTGATSAQVWLRVGDELRLAAAAPERPDRDRIRMDGGGTPEIPDTDHTAAVVHDGELLGVLALDKPRGEPVSGADEKLVDGLAGQAGLLLRNQRLNAELLDLVDQLRASRQRLVAAQDEERRRLERDLHDGAQQQIVALKLKASAAKALLQRGDTDRSAELLDQLVTETDDAVESLRELAHGIYPPLLQAEGLGPALRARASKAPVRVEVTADGERYPREVEAAVYFCVLEALQNVVKYADADRVEVDIKGDSTGTGCDADDTLSFRVADDGAGFDPDGAGRGAGLTNMHDRVDALGGDLEITSAPGQGTTVRGVIPIGDAERSEAASDGAPRDQASVSTPSSVG